MLFRSDLNADGRPDLATASQSSNSVSVLLGNGNGTFGTATSFAVSGGPFSIAIGDLNGDGKPDLATANFNTTTVSVLLNTTDPAPPVVTVPAGSVGQASSVLGGTVSYSASAFDAVDGAITPVCSPASGSAFPLGVTSVTCSATNLAGNTGSASFTVTVAIVAITVAPPVVSTSQSAPFAWSSLFFSRFACSLDGAAYAACSSPRTYNGLAAGSHTLCVQATADVLPTCRSWSIVSPGSPVVSILGVSILGRSAAVSFTSDQAGSRFMCSLDGALYRTCSSPLTYNGLALGSHTVRVLATNFAGDTSAAPAVASFTVS